MHVKTHSDQIFTDGSWEREEELTRFLEHTFSNDLVELVDAVWPHNEAQAKRVVTDTVFLYSPQAEIIPLQPELWGHLFYLKSPIKSKHVPTKKLNCLMNRLSGERLMLFFELAKHGLIDNNHISFNCLNAVRDPSVQARQQAFDEMYHAVSWSEYQLEFEYYQPKMPILLEVDSPDFVALDSEVTIVSETYVSDSTIAFSEKIFRAIQMPRPWLLNCSPGSVALLRDNGFDVLDDVVNHNAYDHLYNGRIEAMLGELDNIIFDAERCERAALHNYNRLHELNRLWPEKLKQVLTHAKK
jgi:hypothetical protein